MYLSEKGNLNNLIQYIATTSSSKSHMTDLWQINNKTKVTQLAHSRLHYEYVVRLDVHVNQVIVVQVFHCLYISVSINLWESVCTCLSIITVQLILESKYKNVVKEVLFVNKTQNIEGTKPALSWHKTCAHYFSQIDQRTSVCENILPVHTSITHVLHFKRHKGIELSAKLITLRRSTK